jgi:hypothetical protein
LHQKHLIYFRQLFQGMQDWADARRCVAGQVLGPQEGHVSASDAS